MGEHSPTGDLPALGVDLGATKVAAAIVHADGRLGHAERWPTGAERGPEAVLADLLAHMADCRTAADPAPVAIGIGVAAQVGSAGVVRFAPNLRWREFPLGPRVGQSTGLPTRVINDVRAATLGEWRHGAARGERFVVCLFIGTGLGGGAVSDGRLITGASNAGGEIGHLTVTRGGRRCTCGNDGCLEAYVGGWAIAARAQELIAHEPAAGRRLVERAGSVAAVRAEHVAAAAADGDDLGRRVLAEARDHLADGLVGIGNAFNPALIVAGGSVVEGTGRLFEEAFALARPRMLPSVGEAVRCTRAALGENAVTVGAAAFARGDVA